MDPRLHADVFTWIGAALIIGTPLMVRCKAAPYTSIINSNYSALVANGISITAPSVSAGGNLAITTWIDSRRNYLSDQLNTVSAPFEISNNGGNNFSTNAASIVLIGKAPVEVAFLRLDGASTNAAVTWTSVTNWSLNIDLQVGTNSITVH